MLRTSEEESWKPAWMWCTSIEFSIKGFRNREFREYEISRFFRKRTILDLKTFSRTPLWEILGIFSPKTPRKFLIHTILGDGSSFSNKFDPLCTWNEISLTFSSSPTPSIQKVHIQSILTPFRLLWEFPTLCWSLREVCQSLTEDEDFRSWFPSNFQDSILIFGCPFRSEAPDHQRTLSTVD